MTNERYLGDGAYASLDPAPMIILRTNRVEKTEEAPPGFEGLKLGDTPMTVWDRHVVHWIGLDPEVFHELIRFAYSIGWGDTVELAKPKTPVISNEESARDEEDQQRKRDAAEGFPDE